MGSRFACALALAMFLTGCGGGGGSQSAPALPASGGASGNAAPLAPPASAPTQPPVGSIPAPGVINAATTYTVYTGNAGTQFVAAVVPYGSAPSISNAILAPGALIYYPDNSVQIADTLGNFDASQSVWAQTNLNSLLANPDYEPTVTVMVPNSATAVQPVEAAVIAYVAGNTQVVSGALRRNAAVATQATADLASVHVFPRGIAMFDNETRSFGALGVDSNGTPFSLKTSTVNWTLGVPAGCSNTPAGKISAVTGDAAKVTYVPPATGMFPAGCQDIVVATVSAGGSAFSASGNAFFYDPSAGVALSGTVTDSTGKPVPSGLLSFYGGGRLFYGGNLFATIVNGAYARIVPGNRTLAPVAGNVVFNGAKPSLTYFQLTPSSLAVNAPGTTQTQAFAETTQAAQNPAKALPPVSRIIRDSWFVKEIAQERPPFGVPDASGKFAPGSVEAILASPAPGGSGTVTAGWLNGWFYKWDAAGKIAAFAQPPSELGGRHLLQVTTGSAAFNGSPCPAANACFAYTAWYNPAGLNLSTSTLASPITALPAGTILDTDGSFAQPLAAQSGQPYTIGWLRNQYSAGHQTAGAPLHGYLLSYAATLGSQSATISGTWTNADAKPAGTLNVQRSASTQPGVRFTYTGTATRTFYKEAGAASTQVTYGFTGTMLASCGGTIAVTLTGSPNSADVGTIVNWTFNDDAQIKSSGLRATGNVQNPTVTGLVNPPTVATFKVTTDWFVTAIVDPAAGSNPATFHL